MILSRLFILIVMSFSTFALEEKVVLENIQKLGSELKAELEAGMRKSPVQALEICNIKAPIIEAKFKTDDLKIGRISLKNRNPDNSPKDWMTKYIEGFQNKQIQDKYVTTLLDHNRKGLLMPITTMPVCLKCHGANIDKDLYKQIVKKYPNDKAIGYKVGDIRGFFWAEFNK